MLKIQIVANEEFEPTLIASISLNFNMLKIMRLIF